ncbi:hypothetical protein ACE38W_14475 [Chitinophaga sp. Hz27]|uniref:hypothetical protein n=1 Tax=Chitinophaga sp. Hz27 TaxID=3347169 RepID=UPI0035DB9BBF
MTPTLFFQCFGIGILGMLLHLLVKARSLKARSIAANKPWSFTRFILDDSLGLAISLVCLLLCVIGFDEIIKAKPVVADFAKWFFAFVGYTGSSVLLSLFSKSEKQILDTIDKKTNIADGVNDDAK